MKSKFLKGTAILLAAVILLSCIGLVLFAADYYHADTPALEAMASSAITVTNTDGLAVFAPDAPTTGLIFYPGGKVEYTAYAPLMEALAEHGMLCVVPKMPLNFAFMDMNAASDILPRFPQIETWYMGGHSLGGSMAASYAAKSDVFEGLILLATYTTTDLTSSGLNVLSIYGTEDGVLNMESYAEHFSDLPIDTTTEVIIDGGNHAQFGSYGAQDGDGEATISAEDQLELTVEAILNWME